MQGVTISIRKGVSDMYGRVSLGGHGSTYLLFASTVMNESFPDFSGIQDFPLWNLYTGMIANGCYILFYGHFIALQA